MAKRAPGVKSQAISEYMAANQGASPQQVVEALKGQGVEVSLGLAKVIRYGKPGKKKTAVKRVKRTVAVKAVPVVSMSESIRQFIAKNKKAGPKDIQAGLKAEGIKVKLGLISAVKYAKGRKASRKSRTRTPVVLAAARATSSPAVSFEQLIEVKKLVDALGGANQVRAALDALAQLQ